MEVMPANLSAERTKAFDGRNQCKSVYTRILSKSFPDSNLLSILIVWTGLHFFHSYELVALVIVAVEQSISAFKDSPISAFTCSVRSCVCV